MGGGGEEIRIVCKKYHLSVSSDDVYCGITVLPGECIDESIDKAIQDSKDGITFFLKKK